MAESDSSHNSSYSSSNSEESTSSYSSTEASEDLYLSLPAEVLLYQFEPVYDVGEEPSSSSSSSSIPTEMEDFGVSRVGNTDW